MFWRTLCHRYFGGLNAYKGAFKGIRQNVLWFTSVAMVQVDEASIRSNKGVGRIKAICSIVDVFFLTCLKCQYNKFNSTPSLLVQPCVTTCCQLR